MTDGTSTSDHNGIGSDASSDLDVDLEDVPELHPALARTRRMLELLEDRHDIDLSCSACGSAEWAVWRSILGRDRCQNDAMLKCQRCWHVWWHGIPLTRAAWDEELERRDGKTSIDPVGDGTGNDVMERLRSLGYLDAVDEPAHGPGVRYRHSGGSPRRPR